MPEVIDYDIGPFGIYKEPSPGRILNLMSMYEQIPITKIENLVIGERTISDRSGRVLGEYKWFDDTDNAYFKWYPTGPLGMFSGQREYNLDLGTKKRTGNFRLQLSVKDTPGLTITGQMATLRLFAFVKVLLTNSMDFPAYWIHQNAGAFFQGGAHDKNGGWFFIEFWKPEGAQAWVDHLNENYDPDLSEEENIKKYMLLRKPVDELRKIYA